MVFRRSQDQVITAEPKTFRRAGDEIIGQRVEQLDSEKATQLLLQLKGRLPSLEPEKLPFLAGGPGPLSRVGELTRQQEAFKELQKLGFTKEKIAEALAFQQAIKLPSTLPETLAAAAVPIALALGQIPPFTALPEELATVPLAGILAARAGVAGLSAVGARAIQAGIDPTFDVEFKDLSRAFKKEAGTELFFGDIPGLVGRKLFGGFARSTIEGAARLQKRLQAATIRRLERIGVKRVRAGFKRGLVEFKSREIGFLPSDLIENKSLALAQEFAETGLFGAERVAETKRLAKLGGFQIADELADNIVAGASKRPISQVVDTTADILIGNDLLHKEAASVLYGNLDDIIIKTRKQVPITEQITSRILDTTGQPITQEITRTILQEGGRVNLGTIKKGLVALKKAELPRGKIVPSIGRERILRTFKQDIADVVNFRTAHEIRSDLLTLQRLSQSKLKPDPKAVKLIGGLISQLDRAMESAARDIGPDALNAWRTANRFWKSGKKTFNTKVVRRFLTNEDARIGIAESLFKPRNFKQLDAMKKAVGPAQFEQLKGAWLQGIVDKALVSDLTQATGRGIPLGQKILTEFNALGDETLQTLFTKTQIQSVRDGGRILGLLSREGERTGAGALRIIQLVAGATALGIAASPLIGGEEGGQISRAGLVGAGAILIGPGALARFLTNPKRVKLLVEGINAPRGTQQAITASIRLGRELIKVRREMAREQQSIEKKLTTLQRREERREELAQQAILKIR